MVNIIIHRYQNPDSREDLPAFGNRVVVGNTHESEVEGIEMAEFRARELNGIYVLEETLEVNPRGLSDSF